MLSFDNTESWSQACSSIKGAKPMDGSTTICPFTSNTVADHHDLFLRGRIRRGVTFAGTTKLAAFYITWQTHLPEQK